jgi:hypothetical protein
MPFKSKAQRRKFAQLLVEGKISDETYEEWNRSTGGKELPERVGTAKAGATRKQPKSAAKTRTPRKRTAKSRAAPKQKPAGPKKKRAAK